MHTPAQDARRSGRVMGWLVPLAAAITQCATPAPEKPPLTAPHAAKPFEERSRGPGSTPEQTFENYRRDLSGKNWFGLYSYVSPAHRKKEAAADREGEFWLMMMFCLNDNPKNQMATWMEHIKTSRIVGKKMDGDRCALKIKSGIKERYLFRSYCREFDFRLVRENGRWYFADGLALFGVFDEEDGLSEEEAQALLKDLDRKKSKSNTDPFSILLRQFGCAPPRVAAPAVHPGPGATPEETFESLHAIVAGRDWGGLYQCLSSADRKPLEEAWATAKKEWASPSGEAGATETAKAIGVEKEKLLKMTGEEAFVALLTALPLAAELPKWAEPKGSSKIVDKKIDGNHCELRIERDGFEDHLSMVREGERWCLSGLLWPTGSGDEK